MTTASNPTTTFERPLKSLHMAIGPGPVCPKCRCDGFDDWWHDPGIKAMVGFSTIALHGALRCHECSRYFSVIQFSDGVCHSSVWARK